MTGDSVSFIACLVKRKFSQQDSSILSVMLTKIADRIFAKRLKMRFRLLSNLLSKGPNRTDASVGAWIEQYGRGAGI